MSQQQADTSLFSLKNIAPNVWAVIEPGGLSNAGFVVGDDGVAVIDSFVNVDSAGAFSLDGAQQVLAEIRKVTSLPVKYVVNTHYHLDHVSGNSVFVDAGAKIVAQRNVRKWMQTETLRLFGDRIKPEQKGLCRNAACTGCDFRRSDNDSPGLTGSAGPQFSRPHRQ
jgi:cyclase